MTDRERRTASDVPGFNRATGIDDPVAPAEYGDDRETVRENDREEAEAAPAAYDTTHAELVELPNELRGEIRSYYDGKMETAGFARRLRSIASELDRHAESIEAYGEDGEGQ